MTSFLTPVQAVNCPINSQLVPVTECDDCMNAIEVRRPWWSFIVKCNIGNKHEDTYDEV